MGSENVPGDSERGRGRLSARTVGLSSLSLDREDGAENADDLDDFVSWTADVDELGCRDVDELGCAGLNGHWKSPSGGEGDHWTTEGEHDIGL